jgi:hypothetical protein
LPLRSGTHFVKWWRGAPDACEANQGEYERKEKETTDGLPW